MGLADKKAVQRAHSEQMHAAKHLTHPKGIIPQRTPQHVCPFMECW